MWVLGIVFKKIDDKRKTSSEMVRFFYAFVLQTNHLESWPLKKNDWLRPIKMFPTLQVLGPEKNKFKINKKKFG